LPLSHPIADEQDNRSRLTAYTKRGAIVPQINPASLRRTGPTDEDNGDDTDKYPCNSYSLILPSRNLLHHPISCLAQ
jgi:hypothetical protein